MSIEQEIRTPYLADNRTAASAAAALHPMQQAASRLGDLRDGRSRLRPKDLVGLLLCHGARAWRASQPVARVRLRVDTQAGTQAVRICCGGPGSR